jgi:hypothetical protein
LEQPTGLRKLKSLPDVGDSLEQASAMKRVAMARKTDLYVGRAPGDLWAKHEWFKTKLDGDVEGFGAWWVQVSPELAAELTPEQSKQSNELAGYVKKSRSVAGRLKRLFGA